MSRIPLLGCQNEADPAVMREHVRLAREHGINVFIMDWYWYENAPCLERQLNEGLIPALEGTDSRFYLMWANHDATTLWDMHTDENRPLWSGRVDRTVLEPEVGEEWREARDLAFDAATSYQFAMDAGGEGNFVVWADRAMSRWPAYERAYGTYAPHVSIG